MIQLFMKRSGSPVIVPLNLPASHDAMTEAASQLDEASRAGKTEIVEIKSVIANLPSYLGGLDPDSRMQLAQLNQLSSIIAKMDSRERNIYERIPEDTYEYGQAVLRRIGADDELIDTIDGYMDFEKLGEDTMAEEGVRRTEFGLIRRCSSPFAEETQAMEMGGLS